MSSVVISGDTSGTVTLQAPAAAGSTVLTLPAVSGTVLQSGTTVTEAQGGTGTTTGYYGFKNRLINGAMMIDQRNAGASVTVSSLTQYTLDRFCGLSSPASKFSIQQSTTVPAGFKNSLLVTSLSAYSISSGDFLGVFQSIEGLNIADLGWGAVGAAAVTLSFWVRSSLTGTFGGSLRNSDGSRSYPFSYTISSANTWTQISVTIPGDTTGTWLTTNGTGIILTFGLGVGSTYSGTANTWAGANYIAPTGSTSVVGTNGATFYITGVQLEKGSTATSFDYRPYGQELALCQRYYWQVDSATYPNTGLCLCMATGGTNPVTRRAMIPLPVPMRAKPSLAFGSTSPQLYTVGLTNLSPNTGAISNYSTNTLATFDINATSAGTAGQGLWLILDSNLSTQSFMANAEL